MHAILFDIQRFCLHDGPGIRTTLFFKGCPLSCAWCQNPESIQKQPQMAFYHEQCLGCFSCREACGRGAILDGTVQRIDWQACDACGDCAKACPSDALRLIGRAWTPEELLEEVLADKDFFQDSGGGITLSGGEAALWGGFLLEFLPRAKEHGLHVNLETCGAVAAKKLLALLPYLDLLYYDIKLAKSGPHKKYTRADNRLVLKNFQTIARQFPAMVPRMPVVPGINDTKENIRHTARLLLDCGKEAIHLLAYNRLGQAKLGRIQTMQEPLDLHAPEGGLGQVAQLFEQEGIHAVIYD